jgi:hypothetical protein
MASCQDLLTVRRKAIRCVNRVVMWVPMRETIRDLISCTSSEEERHLNEFNRH